MTKFSAWLNVKTLELGGTDVLAAKLPKIQKGIISAWLTGLREPSYGGQIALADLLKCDLSLIRELLDLPYTPFAELLARKILARGGFADFCQKVEIVSLGNLRSWLIYGRIPNDARMGEGSKSAIAIRDALIKWGDPTPPRVLLAEILLALAKSVAARAEAKSAANSESPKITTACTFDKIAT